MSTDNPLRVEPVTPLHMPTIASATVIRPGDRVLIVLDDTDRPHTMADLDRISQYLREHFPAAEVAVLAGKAEVVHQPAELAGRTDTTEGDHP